MKVESQLQVEASVEAGRQRVAGESSITGALKRLRASQPFNYIATSAINGLFKATGWRSELIIKHLHRVGTVRRRLPNGRVLSLWSKADDWVSNQIYWRGWDSYEPETVPLFFRMAERAKVTIDVGAYVGFFTLVAAHANPGGRVFAFEPLPAVYDRLLGNVALNNLSNARCIKSAVGEDDGTAEFFHMPVSLPTSSSLSEEFMRPAGALEVSNVEVIRLDRFVEENRIERVDLVKIDTESTEPQVLGGMIRTLRRDRPAIFCEVLGRGSERLLEAVLAPLGYRYYHLTPEGPLLRPRIEGHPEWLNYLFTMLTPEEVSSV